MPPHLPAASRQLSARNSSISSASDNSCVFPIFSSANLSVLFTFLWYQTAIQCAHIHCKTAVHHGERPILDPDGYMRILNNLIQNVISHSHADKIEIALSEQNRNIKILLSDNGIGIDKEDLKHIFDRLYKCDKGRSEKGSGLGLSIVHELVEKLNGTITADSTPGKGTIFTLFFPLID